MKMRCPSAPVLYVANVGYGALALAVLIVFFLAADAIAGTFSVFGPETFLREEGKPKAEIRSFDVDHPEARYFIKVFNGGSENTDFGRISNTSIAVNGIRVVEPQDFNQQVRYIEKPLELNVSNELSLVVRSKPGGVVTVEIIGIDDEEPTISAAVNPSPNEYGWNKDAVTVFFTCEDGISGILTCPDPVTVESEGAGQTLIGTAMDRAGNSKTIEVTVSIDKSPPSIARSWPPDSNFGTDRELVEIEGDMIDSLSGVVKAELHHDSSIIPLNMPFLSAIRSLNTSIPPGEPWRTNYFQLTATDRAGNSAQDEFSVRYTLGPTVSPTDPVRTELVDNLLTSVDRAIVRFYKSVSRDTIHQIIADSGGRVVGFLPAQNIAIAVFETEHVSDLKIEIENLKDKSEVDVALPAIFPPTTTFDNDSLSPEESAAYDNILSSYAKQWIIDSEIPLNPVNIAVIETGLDGTYGLDSEFADIDFYDLCTPEGQQGQTSASTVDRPDHHGTKITGILAGANNGYGNNGVIRGIAGSAFDVHVFRMNCDGGNDPSLILAALNLIIDGTIGDIDVVNMSFGGLFANPTDVRSIYEGYFNSAAGREILWVGGAGNDNQETACNEFLPSGLACDLDNVVSVAGHNPDNLYRGEWNSSSGEQFGSNWGEGVTLSAPGTGVWTAVDVENYGGVSGTSAATPLVAGGAALTIAAYQLKPSTVKQILVGSTQPLDAPELPEGGLNVLALIHAGRIQRIILDGLQWLRGQQNADGSFSRPSTEWTPAEKSVTSTALAALAFSNNGIDESDADLLEALEWILSQQNADGSISNQGQEFPPKTLDTSFAILSLLSTRNPQYYAAVQLATNYLIGTQFNEFTGYSSDTAFFGGWTDYYPGYSPLVDWYSLPLLEPATGMALHALYFAEQFNISDTLVPADVLNKANLFVTRCQNSSTTNPYFNYSICFEGFPCLFDDGGFTRFPPGNSGPWPETLGRDSYAGATAAGLWSLYALGMGRLDPRIEPAQIWLGDLLVSANADENYPHGDRRYYHYLYYLALAGTAWDWDKHELGDHLGMQIDWYEILVEEIATRQNPDGHWTGGAGETDIDATALAILTLESKWTPPGTGLRFRE